MTRFNTPYELCEDCKCRKNEHSRVETKKGYTCFNCKKCKSPLGNNLLIKITFNEYNNDHDIVKKRDEERRTQI